ncbi:alpha/beta hydrolase [Candidatus Woesearchaeota archaeon]|nr:alpha/beta hydrolase [Candidatus Woesearchaeota archaeon]
MATIFIFHGIEGSDKENWFPWLKKELGLLGHQVFVPNFPNSDSPNVQEWMDFFAQNYADKLTKDSVFIGHSLSVSFILSLLEKYSVKAAFLVAGFCSPVNNKYQERMVSFTDKEFDWKTVKKHCPKFVIFNSDNDPYITLEKSQELADNLQVKAILIKNGGHLNKKSGFAEFPLLLEEIKKWLGNYS